MRFAAPTDRTVRLVTGLSILLLLGVTAAVGVAASCALGPVESAVAWTVALLSLAILAVCWGLAPRGFSLEGSSLRVERPLRPVTIPLSEVREAGLLPDGATRGALRIGGSGGLFGFYGWFWNRSLGGFRMYASRAKELVRVDTVAGRFVLSPEPRDRFLEALLGRAPRAARAEASDPLVRAKLPPRAWGGVAAALALVVVAVAGILAATLAFSPTGAVVTDDGIRIERRAAPPVLIPLDGVTEVRRLERGEVGSVRRVSGYAGFGCAAYGRFRTTTLGDIRLYAWRCGPWVLLATREERIIVTPEEPDEFVVDVRAVAAR